MNTSVILLRISGKKGASKRGASAGAKQLPSTVLGMLEEGISAGICSSAQAPRGCGSKQSYWWNLGTEPG